MAFRTGSANFSKGELAEELIGRIDVAAYATALRRARNVTLLKYGGVTKRPGTRLVGEVRDASAPVRLLPFQFSLSQTYVLEMGQGYTRFAANGAMLIEDRLKIVAVTKGAETTVQAAFHGYAVGDHVYFSGVAGMVELNGRTGRVTSVIDASRFTVAIDSTDFSPFTGDSGGTSRTAPPAPPAPAPVVPAPAPEPTPPDTSGGGYYYNSHEGDFGSNPIP